MLPNIQTILYATDLQGHDPKVFRYAVSLAERYQAKIVLLNVLEPLSPSAQAMVNSVLPKGEPEHIHEDWVKHVQETLQRQLRDFCNQELGVEPEDCGVVTDILIGEGQPAATILQKAKLVDADVIVMGTHGRTGVSEMLLGSVAHKVVHRSPIPVFLVPLRD